MVQAVRQESADQLKKKDSEILGIQDKLRQASLERDSIRNQAALTIQQRETEFSDQLQRGIAAERSRLEKIGLSTPEVEKRLNEYESTLTASFRDQLQAFRAEAEANATQREKAVNEEINSYQASLKQVQDDRKILEQTYADREAQLSRQLNEQSQQLASKANQAQTELARLQTTQTQDDLLTSQILDSYATTRVEIGIPDYKKALDTLATLRASFDQEPAVSSRLVQERRPIDMFIIGSLEELIRARTQQATETKKIGPEVEKLIASGSASYDGKDWQKTLTEYRKALFLLLGDQQAADRLAAQVSDAGYRIGAVQDAAKWSTASAALDRSKQLSANIDRIAEQVRTLPDASPGGPISTSDLASLLQAKLLVWQIIGSEPVKSEHPELYRTMQRYFDLYSAQQQQRGRAEALASVVSVLDAIGGTAKVPTTAAQFPGADDRATVVEILDKISALVR